MRVLFVSCCPLEHAVTRYRCNHLAEALQFAGHTADVTWIGAPLIRIDHDIVVLHRICANPEGVALADAVERSGATLIYGTDDLVFDATVGGMPLNLHAHAPLHATILRRAHAALASTERLADAVRLLQPMVRVVPNIPSARLIALSAEARATRATPRHPIVAYLSGSATHNADFALLEDSLAMPVASGAFRLWLVGDVALPEKLSVSWRTVYQRPCVDWTNLPSLLAGVTVNLAPLVATPFNASKSAIKWQEAALVGVPTVASDFGPYADAIRNHETGLLASGSDAWQRAILWLCANPAESKALADAARERVLASASALPDLVAATFCELAELSSKTRRPVLFRNPQGFVKAVAKKALGRV
jgi:glycosyltransferase involved in cell wall biosynthesis